MLKQILFSISHVKRKNGTNYARFRVKEVADRLPRLFFHSSLHLQSFRITPVRIKLVCVQKRKILLVVKERKECIGNKEKGK